MSKDKHKYNQYSDEDLVSLTIEGDSIAFEEIYNRYRGMLVNYYNSKVSDFNLAEDLCQKTFLKVAQILPKFDLSKPFKPWFFTVAYNLMIDDLRKSKSEKTHIYRYQSFAEQEWEAEQKNLGKEEDLYEEHGSPSGTELLPHTFKEHLTDKQQKALELRYLQELSYEDVAIKLGVKPDNARQIISRALKTLKTLLRKES